MPTPFLPYQRDPIAGNLTTPNSWYEFFRSLRDFIASSGLDTSVINDILARLDELEQGGAGNFIIQGLVSVQVIGLPQNGVVQVQLLNDLLTPGNTYYYGTDSTGVKGWFAAAGMLSQGDGISLTVGSDGVTEVAHGDTSSVVNLTADNSGAVVLQDIALTFDEFGHVTGATAGTVNLNSGGVIDHNSTGGLQGTGPDYFHLPIGEADGDQAVWDEASGEWVSRTPAGNGSGILGTWQWAPGTANPSYGQFSAGTETSPALATELIFNRRDRSGQDHAGLQKLIASGWRIYGQSQLDPDAWGLYEVTGTSTPVGTESASVPVALIQAGPNPLTGWSDVNLLFTSGSTSLGHNELTGLQGGTTDEYYHLSAAEHALVGTALQPGDPLDAPVLTGLQNAVDDAAAATAGVPVGGVYRNGSALMVRVA